MTVSNATTRPVTEMASPRTYKRVWDSSGSLSVWPPELDEFAFVSESDEAMSTISTTGRH